MSEKIYGIDMGTNSIKIYQKAAGVILHQKNMIAMVKKKEPLALGDEAYSMYEKAPKNIEVKQPIINGVIADFTAMQTMIQLYFKGMHGKKFAEGLAAGGNAEFYIAVPSDITEVEKRAFYDLIASSSLKTKKIRIVEKPIADALGAGLDVMDATGRLIVNIGADTTEISVISLGGLVLSDLLHFGGNRIDESIITYVKRTYNLVIGQKTAQALKEKLGSGIPGNTETMVIVGRDVVSGLPIEMEITGEVVYEAIKDNLNSICNSIKMILEKTPPELAKDIIHSGIYITGGSSQIHNLSQLFKDITGIEINTCEEPEECVVRGLVKIVSDQKYKHLAFSMKNKILK